MTLGELLDELRRNVLRDRSDLVAGDSDSMWTDETLIRYIGDAERRFARKTMLIRDSTTPECTTVRLKQGVTHYPLHPSTISVISGRFDTDVFDLRRSGHGLIQVPTPDEVLTFDPVLTYSTPPGRPLAYYTDETLVFARQGKVVLSVYPVPDAAADGKVIRLRIARSPMTEYSTENLEEESEIAQDYQLDVLEWAAYRAQRGFDGDAGSPTDAMKHKDAFEEAVKNAIRETRRTMQAQMSVRYGGNGFSWVR